MPRAGSKKNMSVTLTKQRSTSIERLRQAKRHLDIANRYSFEEDNLADHVSSIQRDKSLDGLQQVLGIGYDHFGVALNITENNKLESIDGLSGLQGKINGSVVVVRNPSLKALSGLQAVSEIGKDVKGDSLRIMMNERDVTEMMGKVMVQVRPSISQPTNPSSHGDP